jgi:hypothetical protein
MKSTIFWDIAPCIPLSVNTRFGGTFASIFRVEKISSARNQQAESACHLLSRWFLAELISPTLKMETICSSEMSDDTQRTTQRYIPEVVPFITTAVKNLKSYTVFATGQINTVKIKENISDSIETMSLE